MNENEETARQSPLETEPAELSKPASLTPMVRQYREIKARHADKVLLYRVGDFYEMFFDDARDAAQVLNIALTSRNDMPMCGFPFHAAAQYIHKLVAAGRKVAVCEQLEDPSKAKGLVKRDIVSVVTPATVLDDNFVVKSQNNFLLSLYGDARGMALSFVDVATGDFYAVPSAWFADKADRHRLFQDELNRFTPSEAVWNDAMKTAKEIVSGIGQFSALSQPYPEWYFEEPSFLKSAGAGDMPPAVTADAHLLKSVYGALRYLSETQPGVPEGPGNSGFNNSVPGIVRGIKVLERAGIVEMDDFTVRNLELVRNMQDGSKKFTLLDVLDRTFTPMGGRLLRRFVLMPLTDLKRLRRRQNSVEAFCSDSILLGKARDILKQMGDIDRLASRLSLRRAIPRDLVALSMSLKRAAELKALIAPVEDLACLADDIDGHETVTRFIDSAILPEPSSTFGGDVIRRGYDAELDGLRDMMNESKDTILKLQSAEREKTGIGSLKVKYNSIFGYFIEVSKSNAASVPSHYIRKQSLVNAERYTVPELSDYEAKIAAASERVAKLEEEIFNRVLDEVCGRVAEFQRTSGAVAHADAFAALGLAASENQYVKPRLDDGASWEIIGGRHPVVEKHIGRGLFVPNDTKLDDGANRILVITGPNMAGKSTYLRQNALIAVMAQMGSFVPAKSAELGIVDKIFTRIGASDNLSQGQSTFLVEMREAANILKNATSKSLIIMDELGRGTSTYDGLSIAWAVIEYLYERPATSGKTLFATHYHELTKLGENAGIKNFNISVREFRDELVFLRRVVEGPADKSYGIYVARMAGIPEEVVVRAKLVLETLESGGNGAVKRIERIFQNEYKKKSGRNSVEMELFTGDNSGELLERIRNLNVDGMTPLEALAFLAEIKKQLR